MPSEPTIGDHIRRANELREEYLLGEIDRLRALLAEREGELRQLKAACTEYENMTGWKLSEAPDAD